MSLVRSFVSVLCIIMSQIAFSVYNLEMPMCRFVSYVDILPKIV